MAETEVTLIVNLFGGPGSGKSTMAAEVFAELKRRGVNVELVTEYAKDLTWQGTIAQMSRYPIYFFAKQHHRVERAAEHVDVVITDSPGLLGLVYQECSPELKTLILAEHWRWEPMDIFLERGDRYSEVGRNETLEEAKEIDQRILQMLYACGIDFMLCSSDSDKYDLADDVQVALERHLACQI